MASRSIRGEPWPWVGLASGLGFMLLAVLVVRRGALAFDEPVASAVRSLPVPTSVWEALTFLGGSVLIPIGVGFVLAVLASGRLRLAIIVAVTLLVATLFTDLVKDYVARQRPPDPLTVATGFSFPSGHTLNSTATYGLIALVTWRARVAEVFRRLAVGIGIVVPFLVGLSRIALGVHWPTDVLAGWLAGTALVSAAAIAVTLTGAMERDVGPRGVALAAEPPADGEAR